MNFQISTEVASSLGPNSLMATLSRAVSVICIVEQRSLNVQQDTHNDKGNQEERFAILISQAAM